MYRFARSSRGICIANSSFHNAFATNLSSLISPQNGSSDRTQSMARPSRSFHSSRPKEILPLVGAAAILLIGRYSYRAMNRMEEEWEEYQWLLKQYEKQKFMNRSNDEDDEARTIAIDLGSVNTKLASSHPKPEVMVSREGHRSFFNGILVESDEKTNSLEDGPPVLGGQTALDKFFYGEASDRENSGVLLPYLQATNNDGSASLAHIVKNSTSPPLQESLERLDYAHFRQVVTVPVQLASVDSFRSAVLDGLGAGNSQVHSESSDDDNDASLQTIVVPDAVATVWGAQQQKLIPSAEDAENKVTMVVDMGGFVTQFSLVQRDVVLKSLALPMGGETLVELLQQHLKDEAPTPLTDSRSLAALQIHARSASGELSSQSVAQVHVPYVFADPANHHLDLSISRSTLESLLNSFLQENMSEEFQGSLLSRHLPLPKDVPSLFISILTELLEQGATLPSDVHHILLVGGASRVPVFKQGLVSSLEMMALSGPASGQKLVQPTSNLTSELAVLGATTMIPNYEYDLDKGLCRKQ